MKRRPDRRRDAAKKIAGAKLMQPPQLCRKCVWAVRENGRGLCPFPRCVVRERGWRLKPD
ncbi:MAG: hypothetical protein HDT26_12720 [Subdoligranulum sp.]|nr:hypothetical protein [Subdoligranulum sp.]